MRHRGNIWPRAKSSGQLLAAFHFCNRGDGLDLGGNDIF
jgi:hypothetical protein